MPVKDRNPFAPNNAAEEGKADVGVTDPFTTPVNVVKCPVCGETKHEKIETTNTPTEVLRNCKSCGNKWSCGSVGGKHFIPITDEQKISPREPDPLDDVPDDFRMSGTDKWFD